MAAQAPPAANNSGPIDNKDVDDWKNRFNEVLGDASGTLNHTSPEDAREWNASFFGCLDPIDKCLLTYCLPCVTFGRIHHRTRKNANMEGYEPVNTSCLLFMGAACFGLHWIPESMQRMDIRKKYHLKGNCLTDIAVACCCALCDLTQQDKEAETRERELASGAGGAPAQYSTAGEGMVYPGGKA